MCVYLGVVGTDEGGERSFRPGRKTSKDCVHEQVVYVVTGTQSYRGPSVVSGALKSSKPVRNLCGKTQRPPPEPEPGDRTGWYSCSSIGLYEWG